MSKKKKLIIVRILKIFAIFLAAVIVAAAGFAYWFVTNPWPQVNGELSVKGLQGKVTVLRNKFGVPDIYAENDHDLFFAQGYVQAQDRLFQMDVYRHIGNGRLAELVGQPGVGVDRVTRTYGLRRIAEKTFPLLDDAVKAQLQAYADGVNAYIESHPNKLPVEYSIVQYKPEPWTPLDSMSWANVIGMQKGLNVDYELLRAQLNAKLGEKMTTDALPSYDPESPIIISKDLEKYSWKKNLAAVNNKAEQALCAGDEKTPDSLSWLADKNIEGLADLNQFFPNGKNFGWASGGFAVSGKYTESGKPILAYDVHIDLSIPSIWYEMGLHGGNYDVSGVSFPGLPYILLGHNKNIAWAYEQMSPDVEDLYIEKFDDNDNPTKYLYMGKWYEIEKKQELINVKGNEPVVMDLFFTRHGVIMNHLFKITENDKKDLKNITDFQGRFAPFQRGRWEGAQPIALRWSLQEGSFVAQCASLLNKAGNWEEFRHAVSYWDLLGQNFIYIDDQGNIGYQAAAKIPIRAPKHLGIVPVSGWTGENEWRGFIPFDQLPSLYNPPTGYVYSVNNKVTTDDYPYFITYDWYYPGFRAKSLLRLIDEMISHNKPFTIEEMERIQSDTYSYAAEKLNTYLAAVQPENDKQAIVLDYVKKWDARFDLDSIGATIYQVWYSYLENNTFNDERVKYEVWGYNQPFKHLLSLINIMKDPTNAWFDNALTEDIKETSDDIIKASFQSAIQYLEKNYGPNPSEWKLRSLQTVNLKHQILNSVPVIGQFFNSQQTLPIAGSFTSFAFAYSATWAPQQYNIMFGTSMSQIVSFNNLDKTLSVIPTGASGHIFNPHREDQMKLWAEMKHHEMPFTKEGVGRAAVDKLVLNPVLDQ
jgi:penicillin amidase